ncbi:MAG: hypothetical protein PVF24_11850 [Desulfobacterales bacterium]
MKAKLLKTSVITSILIFLIAGVVWADDGRHRQRHGPKKKHFHNDHYRKNAPRGSSHNRREYHRHKRHYYAKLHNRHLAAHRAARHALKRYRDHHKAHRHALRHHREYHRAQRHAFKHYYKNHGRFGKLSHYYHKDTHKHHRKYRPSRKVFSYWASSFKPGWSITIMSKNRW